MGRHSLAPRHAAPADDWPVPLDELIRTTGNLPAVAPNPEWADTPTWAQVIAGPLPPRNHLVAWAPLPDADFAQKAHLVHVARTWQHAGGAV